MVSGAVHVPRMYIVDTLPQLLGGSHCKFGALLDGSYVYVETPSDDQTDQTLWRRSTDGTFQASRRDASKKEQ